jgi:hypothetical protein
LESQWTFVGVGKRVFRPYFDLGEKTSMYTIDVVLEEMFKELTWFFLFLCVFCFFVSCQDVATGMCTPLLAVASCGVTLIKWSPSGHYVFAATLSKVVRVWETKTWTGERWYTYLCGVCFFILLIRTVLLTLLLFLLNIFCSMDLLFFLLLFSFFSFFFFFFQQDDSHWTLPKCLLESSRNIVAGGRGGLF